MLHFLVHKIFTFYINGALNCKCPASGPKGLNDQYSVEQWEGSAQMSHPYEMMWNANLVHQGNFIDIFLARHVSGTYAHHQEHQMLSCSIWFSAQSFWMGGGLETGCTAPSAPHTRPTQLLSRTPPI